MNLESYILLLSAAFMASLSHCIGMCGGIVLYCNMRQHNNSKLLQAFANICYFIGRMCGYIVIGVVFTLISTSFGFNDKAKGMLFILLGIFLFVAAFIITFSPKWLNVVLPYNEYTWYRKIFQYFLQSQSIWGLFILGVLNGFLPCHLVYVFALKAADTMNVVQAIITMLIFSIGTFLPLFLMGVFSANVLHSKLRHIFLRLSFVIMSYFAVMNVYKGVMIFAGHEANMHHNHHMSTHHSHM